MDSPKDTNKSAHPNDERLLKEYLELQRWLVVRVLRLYQFWDRMTGKTQFHFSAENLLSDSNLPIELRLSQIRATRNRWLVRLSLWAHARLESMRGLRESLRTLYLWQIAVLRAACPGARHWNYSRWIREFDSADLPVSTEVSSSFEFYCLQSDSKTLDSVSRLGAAATQVSDIVQLKQAIESKSTSCTYIGVIYGRGEIAPSALTEAKTWLDQHAEMDVIYGDEDSLTLTSRRIRPRFYADYSLDYLLGSQCIKTFSVWRREVLVEALKNIAADVDASWEDVIWRTIPRLKESRILHIPRLLFHNKSGHEVQRWILAAQEELPRHYPGAQVQRGLKGLPRIMWPLPSKPPLVSLIIPTRDRVDLLKPLMDGLLIKTDYPSLEVIIVDNQSIEPQTHAYFHRLKKDARVRIVSYPHPFNYSAMNNLGFASSHGEILGLLNNDLLITNSQWLSEMVREALRPDVGAVGAKLIYKNGFVQHAGVVLGVGYVARHIHWGEHRRARGYMDRLLFAQPLTACTAACLLVRREVFEKAGGLDAENLPVSYNDIDFCLRIVELGFKIIWTPYAELIHLESATRPSERVKGLLIRHQREVNYFRTRWAHRLKADPAYNPNLTSDGSDFELAFPPRLPVSTLTSSNKARILPSGGTQ